ncbi:DUF2489 domain-containing protein [Rheinheimera sp.]|uniref:DUF2489 domain-containing protein n=1 Tax=Rheinheimera sp. TaxID=1869214 RepID=UPI00307D5207
MTTGWIIAFGLATLLVAGLGLYLGRLLRLLQQQKQQQQADVQKKNAYLFESIDLIGRAMQEGQCELSEGALRIWVLLDHLQLGQKPEAKTQYPALFQMYEVVKDMPTHQARKERDKKEIRHLDHIRQQAEINLKDAILADVGTLLDWLKKAA